MASFDANDERLPGDEEWNFHAEDTALGSSSGGGGGAGYGGGSGSGTGSGSGNRSAGSGYPAPRGCSNAAYFSRGGGTGSAYGTTHSDRRGGNAPDATYDIAAGMSALSISTTSKPSKSAPQTIITSSSRSTLQPRSALSTPVRSPSPRSAPKAPLF
ncbi:hypothetical protein VTG60DRAFT_7300 [Thermothelomyces hinnuleus]